MYAQLKMYLVIVLYGHFDVKPKEYLKWTSITFQQKLMGIYVLLIIASVEFLKDFNFLWFFWIVLIMIK